jgi:hypothetical protein
VADQRYSRVLKSLVVIFLASQASVPALTLAAVETPGAKRYTSQDVLKLSGLQIGQEITPAALTTAAERLGSSGLFKSVSYRYLTKGSQLTWCAVSTGRTAIFCRRRQPRRVWTPRHAEPHSRFVCPRGRSSDSGALNSQVSPRLTPRR